MPQKDLCFRAFWVPSTIESRAWLISGHLLLQWQPQRLFSDIMVFSLIYACLAYHKDQNQGQYSWDTDMTGVIFFLINIHKLEASSSQMSTGMVSTPSYYKCQVCNKLLPLCIWWWLWLTGETDIIHVQFEEFQK